MRFSLDAALRAEETRLKLPISCRILQLNFAYQITPYENGTSRQGSQSALPKLNGI